MPELTKQLRKWALQNAVKYTGKANPGAIIGKLLAEKPELKDDMKTLAKEVNAVVKLVNALSLEQQHAELTQLAPELLAPKKKEEQKHELPVLLGAVQGNVITAFPPEPSGVAHIGHASGALFNWTYAQRYGGTFILRFEDTNPELAKKEYYTAISELLHWLGITWDKQINISDTLLAMYAKAEEFLDKGLFYACTCDGKRMQDKRHLGEACEHRNFSIDQNKSWWREMLAGTWNQNDVVLRFKGDMKHQNGVMRDPVMFRIIKKPHCLHGMKYCVWPSYDFAAAYSDGAEGITHRVRSKEFELRVELQLILQKQMGFVPTFTIEQARINLEGVEANKRKIREKIASGEMTGWDDIRLTTLIALKRRGYTPEGIKNFLFSVGITKTERTLEWASLDAENRKVLDPVVNRYFFVARPEKITITGAKAQKPELLLHPEHPERGVRTFETAQTFYVAAEDVGLLKQRSLYRLMDCVNFTKTKTGYKYHSQSHEEYKAKGKRTMHWLPADEAVIVPVEIMMPDASTLKGLGETALKTLKEGTIIQFARFGFCRLDKKENGKLTFWYAHK